MRLVINQCCHEHKLLRSALPWLHSKVCLRNSTVWPLRDLRCTKQARCCQLDPSHYQASCLPACALLTFPNRPEGIIPHQQHATTQPEHHVWCPGTYGGGPS
jgi:hypothetical protein